jgi:general stress protein CsbA
MNVAYRTLLAVAIFAFGYFGIYRPLQLRWGATVDELHRAMPSDEIQQHPIFNSTRAITIAASPEQIWPWLVQIGYRRAGWYGYDWIDNDGIPSSAKIVPQLQSLKPGDSMPIWRGIDYPIAVVEPNRFLVFESSNHYDSMALALYPVGPHSTRLVWRIHLGEYRWTSKLIFGQLLTDLADFIAVRQALEGVKARAEGSYRATSLIYVELFSWLLMFFGFLLALFTLISRREWVGPFLLAVLIGSNTVVCVLVKPRLFADIIGVLAVALAAAALLRKPVPRAPKPALP